MLKVLIVDDEPLAIEYVISIIKWSELGLEVIGEAEDGVEAIKFLQENKPDIILLDMEMPNVKGLEVADYIKVNKLNVSIIAISGMDKFEYVSESMRLDVENYLLKPFDVKTLEDALLEVSNKIMLTRQNVQEKKTAILYNLLHNKSPQNLEMARDYYNKKSSFVVCIVYYISEKNLSKNLFRLKQYLSEQKMDVNYMEEESKVICIIEIDDEFTDYVEMFGEYLEKYPSIHGNVLVAIGKQAFPINELPSSYEVAKRILNNGILYKKTGVIDTIASSTVISMDVSELEKIIKYLREKDIEKIFSIIDQVYGRMKSNNAIYANFLNVSQELISVCNLVLKIHLNTINEMEKKFLDYNIDQIIKYVKNYYNNNMNVISKTISRKENIAYAAKEFIDDNYADEALSIGMVSQKLYVNVSYIRRTFKNTMNMTVNNYIIQLRMEIAKELIEKGIYRYSDIASMVGYKDAGYFSRSFKKYIGMSPKEYELLI